MEQPYSVGSRAGGDNRKRVGSAQRRVGPDMPYMVPILMRVVEYVEGLA